VLAQLALLRNRTPKGRNDGRLKHNLIGSHTFRFHPYYYNTHGHRHRKDIVSKVVDRIGLIQSMDEKNLGFWTLRLRNNPRTEYWMSGTIDGVMVVSSINEESKIPSAPIWTDGSCLPFSRHCQVLRLAR